MPSPSLRDPRLDTLYTRTPGAVAFLDESYRENPFPGERPFYAMSAVTFAKEQLDHVREVLTDIAGGRYWHTTEAFKLGRTHDITEMGQYLAERVEWSIVTVETTITARGGLPEARQTCLAAAAREVTRGSGPDAVRLLVADRNRDDALNRDDRRTVAALRSTGDIDENVALYHGRMGTEPMLWTADVVAWSAYRTLAVDDGRWIAPVRDVLTVLDARTGKPLDMKQPQAAAATPGAQQTTGENRGQSVVASTDSLQADTHATREGFRRGTSVLDDLVRRVVRVREEAGARGHVDGNTPAAVNARLGRAVQARRPAGVDDAPEPPAPRGPRI